MPYFTNTQDVNIYGGTFTDVQGGINNYYAEGNMSIQHGDPVLQLLSVTASGAAYDSNERYPPPKCLPGTREEILATIESWTASGNTCDRGSVMWFHGPAGAGKSAIAQTICESNAARGVLSASFFFSRGHAPRDSSKFFFTTIAFQMAMGSRELRDQIAQVVQDNPLIVHHAPMAAQVEHLIVGPVRSRGLAATIRSPFLIVVDGVDECAGNDDQSLLLVRLIDLIWTHRLPLYILIVSRPEPHIRHIFNNTPDVQILSLYGDHQADADIYAFLQDGFQKIHAAEKHSYVMSSIPMPWPSKSVVDSLVRKSGGYFIYASTVLRFIDEEYFSPIDRLNEVLQASPTSLTTAFAELDKLYTQILSKSPNTSLLKCILGCVLLVAGTITASRAEASMIEVLLGLRPGEVMLTLRGLHSLLSFKTCRVMIKLPNNVMTQRSEVNITSVHASFADFIFNKDRAGIFFVDAQEHHALMTLGSWRHFANWADIESSLLLVRDRQYLLESFFFNFSRLQDKKRVLEGLKIANVTTWMPLVHASKSWPVTQKHNLVEVVDEVIQTLENLSCSPHDVTRQLSFLTDFIFTTHLSPTAAQDFKFIQGIFTMFSDSAALSEVAEILQLSQAIQSSWEEICHYMNTWSALHISSGGRRLCERPSFVKFMSTPRRCGNRLFIDPVTSHLQLAQSCIESLLGKDKSNSRYRYANECLSSHLSLVPLGEERMLNYIRNKTSTVVTQDRLNPKLWTVVEWLERISNPPADVLLRWRLALEKSRSASTSQQYVHPDAAEAAQSEARQPEVYPTRAPLDIFISPFSSGAYGPEDQTIRLC